MAHVEVSVADRIMEIRLNRPEKKNALTGAMYAAIADALGAAEADRTVRCVLLCAAGDSFCAGNDLNDFLADRSGIEERPSGWFLRALAGAQTVIVAAVQGAAVGVGATMLLHCDLIVAAPDAALSVPFVRLGVTPEAASSLLLPRLIGHQRAMELFLLGEPIGAEQALAHGLVNRIVEASKLLESARALASRVASLPPEAVRATKRLARTAAGIAGQMAAEAPVFAERLRSPETKEAMTAFFEKRQPHFD
ncbi:MAG TPA: enoyl-CoA hydratase [Acetobacteraceae bacterium]|nr:enoyl-CoA hydratase [Acetobacteraceae bacterium]